MAAVRHGKRIDTSTVIAVAEGFPICMCLGELAPSVGDCLGAPVSMMPTMQFSGMFQPVSTLEGAARVMGTLWPAAYYLHVSVGTFTKGLSASALIPDLIKLAMLPPVFWFLCVLLLKKQEK